MRLKIITLKILRTILIGKFFHLLFINTGQDPFYFKNGRKEYLFFENYNLLSMRGKISCAEIFQGNLTNVTDVIKKTIIFHTQIYLD